MHAVRIPQSDENPELSSTDFRTKTWERLERDLTQRLLALRDKNDGVMAETERGHLLGAIAEVKRLLSLRPTAEQDTEIRQQHERTMPQVYHRPPLLTASTTR